MLDWDKYTKMTKNDEKGRQYPYPLSEKEIIILKEEAELFDGDFCGNLTCTHLTCKLRNLMRVYNDA